MKKHIASLVALSVGLAIITPAKASSGHISLITSLHRVPSHTSRSPHYHSFSHLNESLHYHSFSHLSLSHAHSSLAHRASLSTAVYHRAATQVFAGTDSQIAIAQAATHWNVDQGWLLRVATCESGLNPSAYNPGGPSGLFQFMPGTYWAYAARIGETRSYWNPYGSANVAAYLFSIGHSYEWECR